MPTPFLLIDGYNLMHAADFARSRYGPGDLQAARRRLQQLLASLLSREAKRRTTIVYDAYSSPSDDQRIQHDSGMTIRFAPRGGDADTEMEKLIRRHSSPRQLIVVSSDHRLHKAARRRRARCIDSEQFLADLQRSDGLETNRTKSPESSSSRDGGADHIDKHTADQLQQWASRHAYGQQKAESPFSDEYLEGLQQQIDQQQRQQRRRRGNQ